MSNQDENRISNFDETIERYYYSNEAQKESKKQADKLKKDLKKTFKIGDKYQTRDGKFELSISEQNRNSTDKKVLMEILKERGFDDAIIHTPTVDEGRVEELLHSGELTAGDLKPAITTKTASVLKVKALATGGDKIEKADTQKTTKKAKF